jgi:ferritin-like metal-binding protein YciE
MPEGDVAIIAAAQKVEHYEIASYETVRTYAELLGDNEAADLLEQTLEDEKETDLKLTGPAENINMEAREEERRSEDAKTRLGSRKRPAA